MASSAPWARWGETDLGSGSGRRQCWAEAAEQDAEKRVEVNGLMGQWEESPAQEPSELEFLELSLGSLSHGGLLAQTDGSFDLSDPQEFEWGEPRRDADRAGSPPTDEGEELEHDGTQEDPTSPGYWHPQGDRQLDMTEEDEDRASSGDVARQEGGWEAGSEGEGYPELSFEAQDGSGYSTSPDGLRDAEALYGGYGKSLSITTDNEEELSGCSDVSPPPSSTLPEHPHRPAQRTVADALESLSQLGESLEFPPETEFSSPSGRHLASPGLSPLPDSTRWNRSRSLLHHLSVEDLQNAPSIDAETFPESSYAESLEDPPQTFSKATSAGGVRASLCHLVPAAEPSEGSRLQAAGTLRALRQAGSLQQDRARKLKIISPALPSKFSRQSRSLSPRRNAHKQAERPGSPKSGPARPSPGTAEALPYGRGQLNYPLPDLSKVEPRVRFPKDDQSYRPPRGRTLPMRTRGPASPVVFKSPAEIVREVLLNSAEGSPQKCPTPSSTVVPEEFRSPKEATELVQQLQEDYHRLLTKYAEAENTIDQLRLRAKVNLYADPPKPSHNVHMGTVAPGSRVMAFSIPRIRTAELSSSPAPALPAALQEGAFEALECLNAAASSLIPPPPAVSCSLAHPQLRSPRQQANLAALSSQPLEIPPPGLAGKALCSGPPSAAGDQATPPPAHAALPHLAGLDACASAERRFPVDPLTQTLAGQARKFETQVESFEGLIQTGRLTPQAQLTGFARLKEAQDALERAYLQAREETHQQQQRPAAAGPLGVFDPDRAVEGKIFLLGLRLEELKDGIDRAVQNQPSSRSCSEPGLSPGCLPSLVSEPPLSCPRPSVQAPVPAVCTPYPEGPVPQHAHFQTHVDAAVSSASGEPEEEREELPETLQHKQLQVELDYETLLDQYSRFKALPGSLSMEQLGLAETGSSQEVDGPAAEDAGTEEIPPGMLALMEERSHVTTQPQPREWKPRALRPGERQPLVQRSDRLSSTQGEESLPRSRALPARPQGAGPEPSVGGKQEPLSGQSSVAGSAVSEYPPHKPFRRAKSSRPEDHRIVSPGTDSGFVGSEASRVSPLTRSPEHHFSRPATPGMLGRSGPTAKPAALRASLRKEASPVPPEKGLQDVDPSASQLPPRGSARRHSLPHGGSLSQASSPPQWTNSISSEAGPDADITHTDSEAEPLSWASPSDCRPGKARRAPSSASASPSPGRTPPGPLGSRLERDQAIRALQDEVSRLRQRLEESLHRSRSCPEGKSSPRPARSRRLPVPSGPSAPFGQPAERSPGGRGEPAPAIKPARRARSASLPRDGPELDLTSESDCSAPQARDGEPRATVSSWQSPPRALDTLTFRGQYTGSASAEDTLRPAQHSTPRKTLCPICSGPRSTPASKPRDKATHGAARGTESTSSQGSGLSHRPGTTQQQQQQPGLWYLAAPPLGTAVNYIPTVPLVPYSPPVLYCAPPAPTSVPDPAGLPPHYSSGYSVAELKPRATRQQAHHRRHSLMLGIDRLEDLNWSLSRAVEAAKSVKFTTKQMNRSLTSELSKARSLRRSCLF
ncbi:microtubule organization protein AKNA isoform X2 [Pelodiscus sinensis]|uniref:microtubule organization protein AKNA isoform X2 n=1 Tax=Pelodiscus sinensis TaxID=13735 RepID=UPI003F6CBD6C